MTSKLSIRDSLLAPHILEGFARIGCAARGFVYLLIGCLAAARP